MILLSGRRSPKRSGATYSYRVANPDANPVTNFCWFRARAAYRLTVLDEAATVMQELQNSARLH